MKIKEIFSTKIEEKIDPVVKVADLLDEKKVTGELGSYVVTPSIEKFLERFFEDFTNTIYVDTEEIGVWVSGYFGSGKSYLAKILALLIQNREIDGISAVKRLRQPFILPIIWASQSSLREPPGWGRRSWGRSRPLTLEYP